MSTSLQLSRSSPATCAQVRCTSLTGARGPAGTPCRASSALTAVGGLRDGGDGAFSSFLPIVPDVGSFPTHRPSPFTAVIRLHLTVFIIPVGPELATSPCGAGVCLRACVLTCSLTPPLRLPATFSPPAARSRGAAERDRKTTSAPSP